VSVSRFVLPAVAAAVLAASFALAEDTDKAARTEAFPALFAKIAANAALQERWATCPADLYQSQRSLWSRFAGSRDVELEECEGNPYGCYYDCFEGGNENACFELGRAFQDHMEPTFSKNWETMFAHACAAGSRGGCTNRGAGIRNGGYEDDPFYTAKDEERDACLLRTFEISCSAEDPWGCTMLGQAYQYGEGTLVDTVKARTFYERSCEYEPDFAACDYAKNLMSELGSENAK
jgi:TPR repeat protein